MCVVDGESAKMDCTPVQTAGVKALIDSGIHSLPQSFILPPHQRPNFSRPHSPQYGIPLIDLAELDGDQRTQTVQKIVEASQEWGFFQVVNHGMDPAVSRNMMNSARDFHELPMEEKMKYVTDDLNKNKYRPGISDKLQVGWMDVFVMYLQSSDEWPPVCREAALEYWNGVRRVAERVLGALSEGLGMPADFLQKSMLMDRPLLGLNYYPRCPDPDLTLGIKAHSDPGTLTILLQDHVGGLQIFKEGRWVAVEPLRDAFVVNIADQMEIVSNGRFKSVEHRALTNTREARLSVPAFFSPRLDAKITPILSNSNGEMQHPCYKECVFEDYIRHFYGRKLEGKSTLDLVRSG